jgi:hypothetical protein
MKSKIMTKGVAGITLITYLMMVTVNALANILPINGKGTGEVSDAYANLFAPAGITFAIWGLIYLLLLGYTIYQLRNYKNILPQKKELFGKIGLLFSISSIGNTLWIFAWHYDFIGLSLILMICILFCLIKINLLLREQGLALKEHILIRLPFTVYFGWITVATIANVTTFLVAIDWNGFGISEVMWTVIIIMIGGIIGTIGILYYRSIAYGCVIIWAYVGIGIKHLAPNGFNGQYISVIITVITAIVVLIVAEVLLVTLRLKERKSE